MAIKIKRARRAAKSDGVFPFDSSNYTIIGVGLLLILVGYILLAKSPVSGFVPLVLSPILLVVGYCVVIPYGIIYRKKEDAIVDTAVQE